MSTENGITTNGAVMPPTTTQAHGMPPQVPAAVTTITKGIATGYSIAALPKEKQQPEGAMTTAAPANANPPRGGAVRTRGGRGASRGRGRGGASTVTAANITSEDVPSSTVAAAPASGRGRGRGAAAKSNAAQSPATAGRGKGKATGDGGISTATSGPAAAPAQKPATQPKMNIKMEMPPGMKRLPSFAPPRDLYLGGKPPGLPPPQNAKPAMASTTTTSAGKKVVMPNLNVVRNKNANVRTSKDTTGLGRGRGRGAGRSSTGRGGSTGNKSNLVQTAGIFSEGAGAVRPRKAGTSVGIYADKGFDLGGGGNSSVLRKPVINKRDLKKSLNDRKDKKDPEEYLEDILNNKFIDDGDGDESDFDKTEDFAHMPVMLGKGQFNGPREGPTANEKPAESYDLYMAQRIRKLQLDEKQREAEGATRLEPSHKYPATLEELFTVHNNKQKLMLIYFPDSLPIDKEEVKVEVKAEDPSKRVDSVEDINPNEIVIDHAPPDLGPRNPDPTYSLRDLPNGQIGRLVRYKSGKVKMFLGSTPFHLGLGAENAILENVMSITTNPEQRNGDMINLGRLHGKVIASPDWESLLHLAQQQSTEAAPRGLPTAQIDANAHN